MTGTKVKKQNNTKNPLEAVSELGSGVINSVKKDVLKDGADDFFDQLLNFSLTGSSETQKRNDKTGEIEIFSATKSQQATEQQEKHEPRIEAAIDYHRDIIRSRENFSKRETYQMNSRVEEVLIELKSLIATTKTLQAEFAQITVEDKPVDSGIYHANFLEWMITVIKQAREKVEDSAAWLNAVKGKGSKKSYWGMFKKHGTTFGLSGERSVATQVG